MQIEASKLIGRHGDLHITTKAVTPINDPYNHPNPFI